MDWAEVSMLISALI